MSMTQSDMTDSSTDSNYDATDYDATEGTDEAYRSLSVMALVAMVLGIASPLVFAAPLLLILPLLALTCSVLALRRIAASPDVLTGRALAQIGLLLALTCLTAVGVKGYVAKQLLARQTEPIARQWIDFVVKGNTAESYLMTFAPVTRSDQRERLASTTSSAEGETPQQKLASYAEQSVVKRLQTLGSGHQTSVLRNGAIEWLGKGRVRFLQEFEVRDAAGKHMGVRLQFQRASPLGGSGWRLVNARPMN